jgi:hypothetical protein
MASVERSVPQERSTAFSAAPIGIRFFFARDSDWLRELESEKPLRYLCYLLLNPYQASVISATFAETDLASRRSEAQPR